MISDDQKQLLRDCKPDLLNKDVDLEKEIMVITGEVFSIIADIELRLLNSITFHKVPPPQKALSQNERVEHEKNFNRVFDRYLEHNLGQLANSVGKAPEFRPIQEQLKIISKLRNFFVHQIIPKLSPLWIDEEGRWHYLWALYNIAVRFGHVHDRIMEAEKRLHDRLGLPAEVPNGEEVLSELKAEALDLVTSDDFIQRMAGKNARRRN